MAKKKTASFPTIDLLPANFGTNGVYYTGAESNMRLGFSVGAAGDFNGDGMRDILFGTSYADPSVNGIVRTDAGVAYLIYGSKTLATTDLSSFVTGPKGVRFIGGVEDDGLGHTLAGVGDINDDGLDDIAIGAPDADVFSRNDVGIVYVIYGTKVAFTADLDMSTFGSFSVGFAIYGRVGLGQLSAVSPAGDINQDGVNDMLVGCGDFSSNGDVDIVYGQKEVRTAHVDTKTASVTTFTFTDGAYLGRVIDGGKDLNGDGIPDILIGGYWATVTPESGGTAIANAGAMWMLPGPFILPTDNPSTAPSAKPSRAPSRTPSLMPSKVPTINPSRVPSVNPSAAPSALDPTVAPTVFPTFVPSVVPSEVPSVEPSLVPTVTPSVAPSENPSVGPSVQPTVNPSGAPSLSPSKVPTVAPSLLPSVGPSQNPTFNPSTMPSLVPSIGPTQAPSNNPSEVPSLVPSVGPTLTPSNNPSTMPSVGPSVGPSTNPTWAPTESPFVAPTVSPSVVPTAGPTVPALKDFELSVNVAQVCFNLS